MFAQIIYAFESEMALHLDDALARRTHALYAGMSRDEITALTETLGWNKARQKTELARVDATLTRHDIGAERFVVRRMTRNGWT